MIKSFSKLNIYVFLYFCIFAQSTQPTSKFIYIKITPIKYNELNIAHMCGCVIIKLL